jgi:predicted transcriptional regulator
LSQAVINEPPAQITQHGKAQGRERTDHSITQVQEASMGAGSLNQIGHCDTVVLHFLSCEGDFIVAVSVRLKPDISKVLERECKRQRKTRTALIHEALLQPVRPRLGDVIREVLADAPQGLGIERSQPKDIDARDWAK